MCRGHTRSPLANLSPPRLWEESRDILKIASRRLKYRLAGIGQHQRGREISREILK